MRNQSPSTKTLALIIVTTGLIALTITGLVPERREIVGKDQALNTRAAVPENISNESSLVAEAAPAGPPKESEDRVNAAGAYLLTSGESLYALRDGKRWPIASVTKLMTALAARRVISGEDVIVIGQEAVATAGEAGDFKAGEEFTADDLVKAMLIVSSNDAAKALAIYYGGEEFIPLMTSIAAEIGMNDTIFADSTGLSTKNLSTANDLNKLVQFIWSEDPEIFAITRRPTITIIDTDSGQARKLSNINLFAGRKDFLGGKTGYIPSSDGNLISIFNVPSQSSPVVIIVLGASDRFAETEKILMKL